MSQKPFTLPRWATTTGQVLEPSEGEKDAGWPRDFKVPADWWNWLNRTAYEWIRYLAGVPAGNLMLRNPGSAALFAGTGTTDERIYMIVVFKGAGDLKEVGGTERHDEWWVGGFIENSTSEEEWQRFPRGLNGGSHYVTTSNTNLTPRHIYRDPGTGDYAAICSTGTGAISTTLSRTSTDGETWIASVTSLPTGTPVSYADNGLDVGSGSVIMMTNFTQEVWTSTDMGINWAVAQTAGSVASHFDNIFDMAYSATLDAWCVVGNPTGTGSGIMTSVDDGVTWTPVTGIPTTAGRHFTGVTVLDDGNFLAVGGTASGTGNAGQGIIAISTAATVFADVAVVPNVHRFARVEKQGARVLAVAQQEEDNPASSPERFTAVVTFDSYSEGASGSWKPSGVISGVLNVLNSSGTVFTEAAPSPEYGDPTLGVAVGSVPALVMTPEETVFTILWRESSSEPTNVMVSEMSHPTVGF